METGESPLITSTRRPTGSLLKQERERHGWSQIHVAERIGSTQVTISRWEKGSAVPGPYYRQKLSELFGRSLAELGLFVEAEQHTSQPASDAKLPDTIDTIWDVPFRRNPFFTGREEILMYLYTVFTGSKVAALTQAQAINGLGGIGKTQIAVEFAYRFKNLYNAVLWVNASSRDTFMADFVALAALLRLPEQHEQDQEIVVAAVKRWLMINKSWLLILDNVEDVKLVMEFLPVQWEGNILLTTRLQALGTIAKSIEVEKMGTDEGVKLLLRRTRILDSDVSPDSLSQQAQKPPCEAVEIVSTLDGLPLALDQAGAYIEETRCGFQGYLNLYNTRRKELLQRRGTLPTDHPASVAGTWSLSFQQVEQINPAAADLLCLLAFLYPDAIPEELITEGAVELGPVLGPFAMDPLKIDATLETLLRYSLIRRNPDAHLLSIHRLVQAVLKDSMDKSLQSIWAERAIRAINRAFPDVDFPTWEQCRRYLPHAQISASYLQEYGFLFPEAARLLNQAANYLIVQAQYTQAELLLQKAQAIREQILDPAHPDTALALNDLGILYLNQGRYQQAQPLLYQALAIRQQALGSEHPATATSLDNRALLYYYEGKYAAAGQDFEQALYIRRRILQPYHSDIASSLDHLAELFTIQGKYAEAEKLYLQALEIQENLLGPDHPDVARTLNNLAKLYRAQGEYAEAEKLYLQALEIQEKLLGPDHPDVARTLNNLARLYRAQGEYSKAEPKYQRALAIRESVFGPNHPLVAESLYSLAKLYYSQGKYLQAEQVCQQSLQIQEKRLGGDHPDIAFTLAMLARIYQAQNKLTQAIDLYQRAMTIRENTLGLEHPHVALLLNSLAEVYQAQGNYLEAESLIIRSLAIREQLLGSEHPYVAYSLNNLAENHLALGNYEQAELLHKQALVIREHNLGTAHPQTASTLHNLAKIYCEVGRYQEAEALFEKALTIREQALGTGHPDVAASLEQYSKLLRQTGREQQASVLEERAQKIRTIAKQV